MQYSAKTFLGRLNCRLGQVAGIGWVTGLIRDYSNSFAPPQATDQPGDEIQSYIYAGSIEDIGSDDQMIFPGIPQDFFRFVLGLTIIVDWIRSIVLRVGTMQAVEYIIRREMNYFFE